MKKKFIDIIIIGFALFAIFFGPGILFFHPIQEFPQEEIWVLQTLPF